MFFNLMSVERFLYFFKVKVVVKVVAKVVAKVVVKVVAKVVAKSINNLGSSMINMNLNKQSSQQYSSQPQCSTTHCYMGIKNCQHNECKQSSTYQQSSSSGYSNYDNNACVKCLDDHKNYPQHCPAYCRGHYNQPSSSYTTPQQSSYTTYSQQSSSNSSGSFTKATFKSKDCDDWLVVELRKFATAFNIPGRAGLNKAELCKLLKKYTR
jgi:hypothetical protein